MASISLKNVSVSLPVFGPNALSLRTKVGGLLNRNGPTKEVEVVRAIRNLSIDLKEGDRVGLRGPNGAGKSTFLRLVGNVYQPTGGSIKVEGTRRCLFGLSSGMEMEATGWENIRIGARRIGVSKTEIDRVCEDVAEFCQLGDSLDRPIRTYSQGMLLRLNFGVMTSKPADIILIDEVIGVGDSKFMERANSRMKGFADQAKILLLASHSNEVIEMFCNQILTFEQGKVAKRIYWDFSEEESIAGTNDGNITKQSFAEAMIDAGSASSSNLDPNIQEALDSARADKIDHKFHKTVAKVYRENGDEVGEWLQKKNVEALKYVDGDCEGLGSQGLDNLEKAPKPPVNFSFTRSLMISLHEILNAREEESGVLVSLNSPWYQYSGTLSERRLLTLHRDLNGLGDLSSLPRFERIQCVAALGPSPNFDEAAYRNFLKQVSHKGIPYCAIWVRWQEDKEVCDLEAQLSAHLQDSPYQTKFLSLKEAERVALEFDCEIEVVPEGKFLLSISEWLTTCVSDAIDINRVQALAEDFYRAAYSQPESLNWPHGYWVIANFK